MKLGPGSYKNGYRSTSAKQIKVLQAVTVADQVTFEIHGSKKI